MKFRLNGSLFALVFLALMLCQVAAEELAMQAQAPWKKKHEDGSAVYTLAVASGWPKLAANVDTKAKSYYRVTWKMKSSVSGGVKTLLQVGLTPDGEKEYMYSYPLSTEWNSYTAYFYSQDSLRIKIEFYINPDMEMNLSLKDMEITEVGADQLSGNLLPDGNFEAGVGIPCLWKSSDRRAKAYPASIVPVKDFVSGEKSLCVEMDGAGEIASLYMPVELGHRVTFKFWAKADQETQVTAIIQGYAARHTGEHFYKGKKIRLDTEWKEYEMSVEVPQDTVKYPDLLYKTMYLCLGWDKDSKGKAYFDDLSFICK